MKLNVKLKTILSIVLFVLVFVGLILIATFCDWQVSEILTKGALKDGEYFADDFFGVMLESVGCLPIYLMIAFVCCVLFWSCLKLWNKKPLNIICAVVLGVGVVAAFFIGLKDSVGYIFEHALARTGDISANYDALYKLEHSFAVYGIELVFALVMAVCAIFAAKLFKPETLKKLLWFSLATVCALVLANVLIMIIKTPVGRMRFRAINSTLGAGLVEEGQVGFTKWFVSNGQPSEDILNAFKTNYGVTDAFKSFPSGHTCSAGSVYALIMIPTLFGASFKRKKTATVLCWTVPIVYTALVAISRIMVGAHYMSDVTFGGTIAFISFVIMWEIFVCKGSHFFALFPKLKKSKVAAADGVEIETNADVNDAVIEENAAENVNEENADNLENCAAKTEVEDESREAAAQAEAADCEEKAEDDVEAEATSEQEQNSEVAKKMRKSKTN